MKKLPIILLLSLAYFYLSAQKKNEAFQYQIKQSTSPIIVDGSMDEKGWEDAQVATDFHMVLPMDTSKAMVRTEVRMTYDQDHLYLIVLNFNALPGKYRVESLRRDFNFGKNDNFLLFMDPFDDQTNGFTFGANAAGAQWDGLLIEGGQAVLTWDNKWISSVKNDGEKWVFEASIPFKSIRYKKGITQWGINFSRLDLKTNEKSSWAPVPRQFPTASLAYTGILVWDKEPPAPGVNLSLIPYVSGGYKENNENTPPTNSFTNSYGLDAKIGITSSVNLDLTVNPDFSQVDVDQQVINLDRFELFFPERRQFFIENGDLFTNFGYNTLRPFFSRRIGLDAPIDFGAKLSGKINKNWRLGIMDVRTGKVDADFRPAQNFSVFSLQRRIFSRSNIRLLFIDKESLGYAPPDTLVKKYSQFNRNLGIEYNLASSNNQWTGKLMALKSFSPDKNNKSMVFAGDLQYFSRKWKISGQIENVGFNYNPEVGYVPRRGYTKVNPSITRLFFPKKSIFLSHGPTINSTLFYDTALRKTDNETYMSYVFTFRKQNTFTVWAAHNYVKLFRKFDPTNNKNDSLAIGSIHRWNSWGTNLTSPPKSLILYSFSTRYGGYYANGTRLNLNWELGYRFQPYFSISANTNFENLQLPLPWGNTSYWLFGPKLDITMTNKLFFSAFLQYNEQKNNMNLYTRFQWRFKPASDFFIVYTDNYLPAPFFVKNKMLVLKLTYWWNI